MIDCTGRLTDKTLAAIARHCSLTLERADLSFLRLVTLPVFLHLLGACAGAGGRRLQEVSVWGCSQLRRAVVEALREERAAEGEQAQAGEAAGQLRLVQQMRLHTTAGEEYFPTLIGFLDV